MKVYTLPKPTPVEMTVNDAKEIAILLVQRGYWTKQELKQQDHQHSRDAKRNVIRWLQRLTDEDIQEELVPLHKTIYECFLYPSPRATKCYNLRWKL